MTVSIDIVRNLHHLHRQLADLRDRLDRGPKQIQAREANVARLEKEFAEAKDKAIQARMAADQKQLQLKTGEGKILDLRGKLNTANSNREYQALLEQIAADEMANSVLEDEILEALDKIEQLQINAKEAEQRVASGKEELEKNRQQVTSSAASITADVQQRESELAAAQSALPADFLAEYERVVRTKGEDSMAAVEDDCCSGCCQQATPNMLNQLYMGQVVACKTCGRLLYLPEDRSIGS